MIGALYHTQEIDPWSPWQEAALGPPNQRARREDR
jgi:hypothetical protein